MAYADLSRADTGELQTPPDDLYAPLPLSVQASAILPFGIAMVLAQMNGNSEEAALLRTQYNTQRAGLAVFIKKQDVLPVTAGG